MIPMKKEWQPSEDFLPCLSIQQPFLEAIMQNKKTQEIRTWQTHYTGPLLLHAGKAWYGNSVSVARQLAMPFEMSLAMHEYPRGAIVGIAHLARCIKYSYIGWEFERQYHRHDGAYNPSYVGWLFVCVERFAEPIAYKGTLGLFPVAIETVGDALKNSKLLKVEEKQA